MKSWTRSMRGLRAMVPRPARFAPIDVQEIDRRLQASSEDVLEELAGFGALLMSEIGNRIESLDGKALSILGYTSAFFAFLLFGRPVWFPVATRSLLILVAGGAVLGLLGMYEAFVALRIRTWDWPSERDWFRVELFSDPAKLRRYHLLSLLETHQKHSRIAARKARAVRWAQWFLLSAGVVLALALVLSWCGRFPFFNPVRLTGG